ncbi:acyl-coenzyme A thioesterase 13-like isoform X2 [Panicum virgatum]|uniref:acyl-coenzyme A thioesterase 13-like isoform X2 n=1 Tax=Panicum virgatum TaxID=38727 RepID=UPI0019D5487E|nr:acyl-coenzyme A thioesterase 13-like isoform X2 [Panicum virgatum]
MFSTLAQIRRARRHAQGIRGIARGMGDEARARRLAAIARKWLEDPASGTPAISAAPAASEELSSLVMAGARVSLAERGRVVCSLRVRAALTDAQGRWHAGAIAAAVDNMCSAVAFTVEGAPTATVLYSLSHFSPAHPDEEVEMEGRVVNRKGKLTSAAVEVRKKESGELIAIGRQWITRITPAWATKSNKSSKL